MRSFFAWNQPTRICRTEKGQNKTIVTNELNLIYDPEFTRLNPTREPGEYTQLEESLFKDGCCEPIIVWNNILVEGNYRFEICYRHGLPYEIKELDLSCREEVISWVCQHSLDQDGISNEMFRYLVGKIYNAEKSLEARCRHERAKSCAEDQEKASHRQVLGKGSASPIALKYNISRMAIYAYRDIAKSVDEIAEKDERLTEMYLSGRLHIKKDNLTSIAAMNEWQIRALTNAMIRQKKTNCSSSDVLAALSAPDLRRKRLTERERRKAAANAGQPSVKDIPTYDPDGEVASLSLTIPSWNSSIDRMLARTDLHKISDKTRTQLREELLTLRDSIDLVLLAIKEVSDDG